MRNFADAGVGFHRLYDGGHEIDAGFGVGANACQGCGGFRLVALRTYLFQALDLHPGIVLLVSMELDRVLVLALVAVAVDANLGKHTGLDVALHAIGLRRHPGLDDARRYQLDDAALGIGLGHDFHDFVAHLVGHGLDVVGAGERVCSFREAHFLDQDLHRPQRDARRIFGGDGVSLVVGTQRHGLRAGERADEGIVGAAHDVHLRLLESQSAAAAAGDHAQPHRAGLFRAVFLFHDPGPQAAAGTEFAHLLEDVAEDIEVV